MDSNGNEVRGMSFSIMAHIYPETEIEVTQGAGSGAWSLSVGSNRFNSPSGGAVTLFASSGPADLLRIRDAITAALAGGEAA